jgi:alpha-tubulin suppressor-like RCC1 family protein
MIHADIMRVAAVGLVLVACTRADSRDASDHRERSGAARRMAPADARLPADARSPTPRVEHIAAGYEHTCALFHGGNVRCWGKGANGRLGTGAAANIGDDETPAAMPDVVLGGRAVQIAAGVNHTCALLDTGKVRCWGANSAGQLGYGHTRDIGDDEPPASAGDVSLDEPVTQVVAGNELTCALLASGRVRCWGASPEGETGHGLDGRTIGDDEIPTAFPALDLGARVTQLTSEHGKPCALLADGAVRCWGAVIGSSADRYTPAAEHPLVDFGVPVTRLGAGVGAGVTCAITRAGRVRCFGRGTHGELGYGRDIDKVGMTRGKMPTPARLGDVTLAGRATQVVTGGEHTCSLLDTGRVRCWGSSRFGVLGKSGSDIVLAQDAVEVDVGGRVVDITAGAFHTCAVLDTGVARCWGDNSEGQLGYGTPETVGELRSPAAAGDVPL